MLTTLQFFQLYICAALSTMLYSHQTNEHRLTTHIIIISFYFTVKDVVSSCHVCLIIICARGNRHMLMHDYHLFRTNSLKQYVYKTILQCRDYKLVYYGVSNSQLSTSQINENENRLELQNLFLKIYLYKYYYRNFWLDYYWIYTWDKIWFSVYTFKKKYVPYNNNIFIII